ncbi:MAG: hypothetical protein JSS83_23240 [Cyanobacteria bacterium SZAS LIN-3]|nr:hypothetical protein [Cyanobacteria bacterium SZAS LIN-3]
MKKSIRRAQILCALSATPLDRLRLMKSLFLFWYRAGKPKSGPFEFKAYLYGPCSFDLYESLQDMEKDGLVVQPVDREKAPYYLTKAGAIAALADTHLSSKEKQLLASLSQWSAHQSFSSLLSVVYKEAPEFASASIVRDRML